MKHLLWKPTAATLALALFTGVAPAQMKVGRNPGSLASDVNLQVEATDGSQVVGRKSTAQVGIGTNSPANKLEVNSGSANTSGVRLTQLPSAALLGTNANGDIVKVSSMSACTCGDIKASILTANHGDWKLMNGSQGAGSCSVPAVDASGVVLTMGGTAGTTSGATGVTLAQNQLPTGTFPVTVSTNTTAVGTPSGTVGLGNTTESMANAGSHTHTANGGNEFVTAAGGNPAWIASGASYRRNTSTDGAGDHAHTMNAHTHTATFSGSALTAHTHTATASSINGGVTPQPIVLSTANFPVLAVNYFVCVN